jgi:diguanylate cyclase (GGDEF)-like protein/PAS domain S-box-containing protein
MKSFFKHWFSVPGFSGDDEISRRTLWLNAVITFTILFLILIIVGNFLGGRTPGNATAIDIIVLAAVFILRIQLWRGRIYPVAMGLLCAGFIFVTVVIVTLGTIRTPTTATYLLLVIIAGILFERNGVIIASVASSLAVLGLILAENAGLLPRPDYTVTVTQWISYSVLFGLSGGLTYFVRQNMLTALKRSEKEIAERRHAELEMRKLLRAVEQSPESIVITDLDGNIEYVNPRFSQTTGYSLAEARGQNPRILKTDQTPIGTHINLWDTLKAGQEWRGEFVNRRKDGSIYYESATISPITDLNGVVTHYLAVKEDITERKRIEEALRASEARFRALFDQTHDAVFILNLEGQHIAVNQRAADMLGYSIDELLRLSMHDTSIEIDQSQSIIDRLLAGEHVPLYERRFRRKDGQVFPVEINAELIRDKSGSPLHIQSVVRDISQRKQVEDALRTANDQLHERMTEIEKLQEELREQAVRDPLTGLYNRRYLDETLVREISRIEREQSTLSIIIADIDHFKSINDTYGHQVGDQFLVIIAGLMKRYARSSDIVCRYGGEEFLLILPGANLVSAGVRAEEIRQKCLELGVPHEGQTLSVSMSFGVATYPQHGQAAEEIIIKADKAMYSSKQAGRNRVTLWCEPPPPVP